MGKKILCALLAALLLLSSAGAVEYGAEYRNQPAKTYAQKFADVGANHWAFAYIAEMNEREVLNGYPNGYFYPENNVTRAEFAKIMCLAAGMRIEDVQYSVFDDVRAGDWFLPYVEAARYYLSGYAADGRQMYRPNEKALREDIAVALVKLKGYSTLGADESALKAMFTDWQSISTDARKYVAAALENGLISGYTDNTFRGQNSITRAEAATLLWRAYQYGSADKSFDVGEKQEQPVVQQEQPAVQQEQPEQPVTEQTQQEEIKQERLPYYCDTLTAAKVSDAFSDSAYDGGEYVYYYDSADRCVYRLSVANRGKTKLLSVSGLTRNDIEITEKEVTKQVPKTIRKPVEAPAAQPTQATDGTAEPPAGTPTGETTEASAQPPAETPAEASEQTPTQTPAEAPAQTPTEYVEETVYETVTETVKEETVKGVYKDFEFRQLFRDPESGTLYLRGVFRKYARENSLNDTDKNYSVLYRLNAGTPVFVCEWTGRDIEIVGAMPDGRLICSYKEFDEWGHTCFITRTLDPQSGAEGSLSDNTDLRRSICFSVGGNLYGFGPIGDSWEGYNNGKWNPSLVKYSFSSGNWSELTKANASYFGRSGGNVWFWDLGSGKMAKSDLTGKIAYVDGFDSKNGVEVRDMKNISQNQTDKGAMPLYVSDRFGFVFYDKDNACWRILQKQ